MISPLIRALRAYGSELHSAPDAIGSVVFTDLNPVVFDSKA
jgi:hypothetical protein